MSIRAEMENPPTDAPPFKIAQRGAASSYPYTGGQWQRLDFPSGVSDGVQSKWPTDNPQYRTGDDTNYRCSLAQSWAKHRAIEAPRMNYYLDRLPDGYACFEIFQSDGSQVYKRLFGHPSGRFFDSIRRFEIHFFWLLSAKQDKCACVLCGNFKGPIGPPRKRNQLDPVLGATTDVRTQRLREQRQLNSDKSRPALGGSSDHLPVTESAGASMYERSRRNARQPTTTYPTDEEGTRDVWREALIRLKNAEDSARGIEIDVQEEDSMDWIAERDLLKKHLTQIELQHSFIPRRGELVLWITDMPKNVYIIRDFTTMTYKLYDFESNKFLGPPKWRGGVIADIPSAASKNGNIDYPDILDLPEKKTSMNTAGFRVETLPDPNNDLDKSMSKQYKYVPLRNIRPLSHWQLILKGIPQKDLHPSILYAITCMTSISLIGKWRFNGSWPAGTIMARAVYIGSELVTVGDTIRLLPASGNECTEIMAVESIRLNLEGMSPQHLGQSCTTLCSVSVVTLTGQAFTNKIEDAYSHITIGELSDQATVKGPDPVKPELVKTIFRPVGTGDYGNWYHLHNPRMRFQVSYDQVLGRLHEADAVTLWSGQRQHKHHEADGSPLKPDLSFDLSSVLAGRKYATRSDERIPELPSGESGGIRWVISDSRAQALAIASINGLDVGPYHDIRNSETVASWRAHIRHANGEPISAELLADMQVKKRQTARNSTENYVRSTEVDVEGEKKRGRKPGSKLINGKIYSAAELANMTESAREELLAEAKSNSPRKDRSVDAMDREVIEISDSDTIEVAVEPTSPQRYRSRMAGAALGSSDEDESEGSQAGSRNEDEIDMEELQPFKTKLSDYETGDADETSDVNIGEGLSGDEHEAANLSAWKSKEKNADQNRGPLTKSQIMESVKDGHGSMIASVQQYDDYYDDDDDGEFDDFDLDEWKNPRNARGGTEESEGGDYRPDESQ